jgi:hypothetical protein
MFEEYTNFDDFQPFTGSFAESQRIFFKYLPTNTGCCRMTAVTEEN